MTIPFSFLPPLSLRSLLINKLQEALQLAPLLPAASKASVSIASVNSRLLPPQILAIAQTEISLNRLKTAVPVRYVSAIAFRLAHRLEIGSAPAEIAQALTEQLNQTIGAAQVLENPNASEQIWQQVWQQFTVQTAEPGWIYLQPSDRGIAIWLQSLVSSSLHLSSSTRLSRALAKPVANKADSLRNSTRIFPLLYTHARCCSVLRLANQTGLIHLDRSADAVSTENLAANSADFASRFSVDTQPVSPFPWLLEPEPLNSNAGARLRYQHPTEQQLISQIVNSLDQLDTLDQLDQQSSFKATPAQTYRSALDRATQCRKLAQSLSQDFQAFYAACRIWGEIEQTDLPLAQARLGLTWIVQKVMRSLLAELGIEAPIEL